MVGRAVVAVGIALLAGMFGEPVVQEHRVRVEVVGNPAAGP